MRTSSLKICTTSVTGAIQPCQIPLKKPAGSSALYSSVPGAHIFEPFSEACLFFKDFPNLGSGNAAASEQGLAHQFGRKGIVHMLCKIVGERLTGIPPGSDADGRNPSFSIA